jgi:hypothetical protein
LTLFFSAQSFAAPDIAGVQIGAPLSAQKKEIEKANPSYQISDIRLTNGKTIGVKAIAEKNGKQVDQFVAIQNDAGVVWFVARSQVLEQGSRIKYETLLDSLKEKYGMYTDISAGTGGPVWYFDRQGKIYQGGGKNPCSRGVITGSYRQVPGTTISVPSRFTETCGTEITSGIGKDSKDGMVNAFSVTIVDEKRMYDELNGKSVAEENERRRKLEDEKSKNVKPKL